MRAATATPESVQGPIRGTVRAIHRRPAGLRSGRHVLAANVAACRLLAARGAAPSSGGHATDVVSQDADAGEVHGALRDGEAVTPRRIRLPAHSTAVRLTPLAKPGGGQTIVHLHDRGEHLQTQARLTQLANFDSLTGLPNRACSATG